MFLLAAKFQKPRLIFSHVIPRIDLWKTREIGLRFPATPCLLLVKLLLNSLLIIEVEILCAAQTTHYHHDFRNKVFLSLLKKLSVLIFIFESSHWQSLILYLLRLQIKREKIRRNKQTNKKTPITGCKSTSVSLPSTTEGPVNLSFSTKLGEFLEDSSSLSELGVDTSAKSISLVGTSSLFSNFRWTANVKLYTSTGRSLSLKTDCYRLWQIV